MSMPALTAHRPALSDPHHRSLSRGNLRHRARAQPARSQRQASRAKIARCWMGTGSPPSISWGRSARAKPRSSRGWSKVLKDEDRAWPFSTAMRRPANDQDSSRQQRHVQVVQLATVNGCHLDANLVGKALKKIELDGLRLLFLENIGNLICPAEFPLGAKARVVVISVTEGPWSVRKHPHMFLGAQIVVINKTDLAACDGGERRSAHRRRAQTQAGYPGHPDQLQRPATANRRSRNAVTARNIAAKTWMHEFSIASLRSWKPCWRYADKESHGVKKIVEVRMTCRRTDLHVEAGAAASSASAIDHERLRAGGNALLEIEIAAAAVRCPHCGYAGPPKYWDGALSSTLVPTLQCPECGKAAEPAEGHECAIKTVKFTREDETDLEEPAA